MRYEPTVEEKIYDKLIHLDLCHQALKVWQYRYWLMKKVIIHLTPKAQLKIINRYTTKFTTKFGDPASDPQHANLFYPGGLVQIKETIR